MNTLKPLKLKEPGLAYGVISGFPIHDSYPVEDRERLDELFREDYFAWKAMSWAAIFRCAANRSNEEAPVGPSPFSHYRAPKQDEPVIDDSSAQGSEADTINVGDLEDYCWSRGNGQYRYPNLAQLFLHSQQEEREWDETEPPVRLKKARACPKPAPLYKEDFSDSGI
jgi:hypothetical protein